MYKHLTTLVFILFTCSIFAQNYTVKGQLQDNEKQPLVGAVVMAIQAKDSLMLGYALSDANGVFSLPGLAKNVYNIQITYIGYGTLEKILDLNNPTSNPDLGLIIMNEEGKLLESVTISAEFVPIKVTKDTIEFNADAFKTQPNAVVEELLKKLPGVEIDADGSIKVQGEDVKAVTVDGKDFFGKDPKMATRNLPANAVKKVQVFDKKSKTSEFTGVDDGNDEKTINLELKDNMKNGYFGNIMGGYGSDDRYEGKAMINRFGKKTQISFLGGLNNLNNSGVNVNDFVSMTGGGQGGRMRNINLSSGIPVSFGQNNTGETNSITTGLNINHEITTKSKLSFSYYLTQSDTKLQQNTLTNSFLPNRTLISNSAYNSSSGGINHNFNTSLEMKLDSTTEMTIKGSLAIKNSDGLSNQIDSTQSAERQLLNLNNQDKNSLAENETYTVSLNLRKKLNKKGRTMTFDGNIGANNSINTNKILSEVFGPDIIRIDSISVFQNQNQFSDNTNYNYGLTYTEPINQNWFMMLNASRKNNKTDLIKDFFELNPDLGTIIGLNEELSRTFDNRFVYNTGGINFRLNKENYSSNLGLDFQNSNLEGIPSIGEKINRTFNYFLPKASIELDKLRIRVNYSTSIREPSMEQLQPVVDNSDPLNVYQGNPNLVPEYRHNLRLSYNFFDQFNFRSLFANLRLGYTKDRITTASFVDPVLFIKQQTPLNTDFEKTMSGNVNYSSPLNFIKAKFRTGISSTLTNGINFINQQENNINRWSHGFNILIENKSKKAWDGSISGRWSFNQNIYKDNESLNTNFINQTYESYLAWFAGKGWTVDTRMEYNIYGQGSFDESTKVKLWQASVSKGFMNNQLTAKLRVFDILNQNQGVNRTASETNISESVTNTIGRYVMLNFTYSLSAMGNSAPSEQARHIIIRN